MSLYETGAGKLVREIMKKHPDGKVHILRNISCCRSLFSNWTFCPYMPWNGFSDPYIN